MRFRCADSRQRNLQNDGRQAPHAASTRRRRRGAAVLAADHQTPTDPLGEIRHRLDPAVQRARDALAAGRESDLAAALRALGDAAEQAMAILERSATSPPPDTPGRQPSDAAGPDVVSQRRWTRAGAP